MRFSMPIILILALLNICQMVKSRNGGEDQEALQGSETISCIQTELDLMKSRDEILVLKALLNAYRDANIQQLRLSAYTARPEETNEDVEHTAIMETPVPGLTVAVSRDLKRWLGKRVYVQGYGVRLVSDLMHPRFVKSIDLLVEDVATATGIGVQHDVLVALIEPLSVWDGDDDVLELCEKIME